MIYVPKGTYLVDGTWTISDALYMYCEPGVTFKLKNNAAANSRILTVSVDGFVLEGQATFDGNRANQSTPSGQYLLHHTDRTDVDLTLYRLTGSPNQGARFVNSTRCSIRVHRLDDTGRQGIFFTNTAGNNIDHNYAWVDWGDRSDNPANDDGIIEINHIDGTSAGTINGNVIGGRGKMHNAPTGSNVVVFEIWGPGAGNRIVSPWCEGGTIGCSLAKGQTHSSIHCDHAFDQKTIGLEIAESDYCQIYGTVDGNSNAGTGCSVDGQGGGAAGNEVFATVRRTVSRAFSNISADDTVFQMNASITTGTGLARTIHEGCTHC